MKQFVVVPILLCMLFTMGCKKTIEEQDADFDTSSIFQQPVPEKIDFHDRASIIVVPAPSPEGESRIGEVKTAEKKVENDPIISVEIVEKFLSGHDYCIIVNFRNTVAREGNKVINIYGYDESGRLVHVETELYYFRKYQNYLKRYNINKYARQVRWILQVN